jgi:hypothetical protein
MNTQKKGSNWWLKITLLVALFSLTLTTVHLFRRHRDQESRQLADRSTIARILTISPDRVTNERVTIDDYRDYYGVYFVCKADGVQLTELLMRTGLRDYSLATQEKHDLVLHAHNYKYLKTINWGPMSKLAGCPQYIGVCEKEYLVYVAICGDQIYGYLQNNYNVPAGSGPFN